MANVILVNKTRRPAKMLVLNLAKNIAAVKVENRVTHETRDGKRAKKVSTKLVPDSIRIPANGRLEVPEIYTKCPSVIAAIKRKDLRIERIEPKQVANGNGGPKSRAKKRA